jgi:GTPase involved in cell partitioning and DNA repair
MRESSFSENLKEFGGRNSEFDFLIIFFLSLGRVIRGGRGGDGGVSDRKGKKGETKQLLVPPGTIVAKVEPKEGHDDQEKVNWKVRDSIL